MLVEAYGEDALGKSQCFEWFNKFKNGDFDVRNEERDRQKFEDNELQATRGSIKCDTRSRLHTFESHGKDPEGGKIGSTSTQ